MNEPPRKPNQEIPASATMRVPQRSYQPTKAELEAEEETPGL